MNGLWHDVRYGLRMLAKNPGFTAVAVLTLALGIGANTAVFSVVNGVLLQPLPYANADRLVGIWHDNRKTGEPNDSINYENFLEVRHVAKSFEHMAAVSPRWSFTLSSGGPPERLFGYWVSASFFPLLGIQPVHGRAFSSEEDRASGPPVALLSHRLWQQRFKADPALVGHAIALDGRAFTVVGIMPPGFRFLRDRPELGDADLWVPAAHNEVNQRGRSVRLNMVLASLRHGVTLQQARAELETIARGLEQQFPDSNTGLGVTVLPLQEHLVSKVRPALLLLLGAVSFVLLIACANLANLFLARASAREREVAVRTALGAGRLRLLRQFVTESLLLALLGGTLGLLFAWWSLDLLRAFAPANLPRLEDVRLDGAVLAFTAAVSLLTGLAFGLAPALRLSQLRFYEALQEGSRQISSGGRRLRDSLVVAEIALTLMLMVGAGLLMRSFLRVMQVDPGFQTERLLTMAVSLPAGQYDNDAPRRMAFFQRMFSELESLPDVEAAGAITRMPMSAAYVTTWLEMKGRPLSQGDLPEVEFRRVSTGYFRAMKIPLLQGREFQPQDDGSAPPVAIINRSLAERFWPGEDAVGKQVRPWFSNAPPDRPWWTVVGVVGDVRHFGLDADPRAELYMHFDQGPPNLPLLAIRTRHPPQQAMASIRAKLRELEPQIVLYNVKTMEEMVSDSVAQRRFNLWLVAGFAFVALALAVVGVYGVLGYSVSRRTREFGVRLALGARSADILLMTLLQGGKLAFAGVALGLLGALALSRLLSSLLFGVSSTDVVAFAAAPVTLVVVALLASWLPARRAAKVDPMVALRYE